MNEIKVHLIYTHPFYIDTLFQHLMELLQLLLVFYITSGTKFQAILLPLGHPLRDALDQELRIRIYLKF